MAPRGDRALRCFVVGNGIVPLAALPILLRHGFAVRGVWSSDGSLRSFADAHAIPHAASRKEFEDALAAEPYELLFSLNNGWLIPDAVIATARRAAINYHDSPLPKYAGLHATSWALLHGEREHAVTFHELVAKIDAGRIFAQQKVPILPDDTALALNTRCYEAAVATFETLAGELAAGTEHPTVQPTVGRSYFGMRDRPAAACVVRFDATAESIANLVRALDFGPAKNPLGLAKVRIGDAYVAVTAVTRHAQRTPGAPGKVVAIDADGIRVTTATEDVTLRGLRTLAGVPLDPALLVPPVSGSPYRALGAGLVLDGPSDDERDAITRANAAVCKGEAAWVRRLASLAPFAHPSLPLADSPSEGAHAQRTPMPELLPCVATVEPRERATKLAAVFAMYAARIARDPILDVGLSTDAQRLSSAALFAHVVPLRLTREGEPDVGAFEARFSAELDRAETLGTFARDVYARHPELRAAGPARLPFTIAIARSPAALDVAALDTDLILAAYQDGSAPEIVWRGAPAAARDFDAAAMARQLGVVARAASASAATRVSDIPLLDEDERARILVAWNDTAAPIPDEAVHTLVAAQASRTPDAPAVRFGGASITYAALDRRANQLARRLRAMGVARGALVAVALERSADMVVALLGVLKAGAAYVPIDPSYPAARVTHMLENSGARVAVSQRSLRARFFDSSMDVVVLDADGGALAALDASPLDAEVTPDDLAYVIYTSGSTGTPKGVEVTHRGLVNHGVAIAATYALAPGDRMLCSASISFDVAGEQIYPALFRGAEVVVRPDDLFESFARFDVFVRTERITAAVLPTAFWHEWVRELERTGNGVPPALRVVSTGTEKVLGEALASWQAASGGRVRFFQGYGPTEATVTCTMYAHDGAEVDTARAVPIGRPLPNTEIYVLDARMRPLPPGLPGEIYVGGAGLARGYHARPDLTAERFVPHPLRPGARLYRTGDEGRFDADGQLVYLGRTDSQVKLRGFRVELGEIENVLRCHPAVEDVAVVLRDDAGAKRLVAYVIAAAAADVGGLVAFAGERLPEYMVPAAVVRLAAFPMTPNQKIDRRALRERVPPKGGERAIEAPRSPLESDLAAIWSTELRLAAASFGVHDDFFALGGDSLRAVSMLGAVESRTGAAVPLSAFARASTIAGLAASVAGAGDRGEESLVVTLQEGDAGRAPLWLIHPVGGHVVCGAALKAAMRPTQRILGIQARGLDGKSAPLDTVEAMADAYVPILRAAQPRGPYFIAGPSMGGFIAIEIARRLQRAGEHVALLGLLDTFGPGYPRRTSRFVHLMDSARGLAATPTWAGRAARVREWILSGGARGGLAPPRYDVLGGRAAVDAGTGGSIRRAIEAVTRACERANEAYRPAPVDVPILLVRGDGIPSWSGVRFDHPTNGWTAFAPAGIRTLHVACEHIALVDRPPPEVGRALQEAMDRALQVTPTAPTPARARAAREVRDAPPSSRSRATDGGEAQSQRA